VGRSQRIQIMVAQRVGATMKVAGQLASVIKMGSVIVVVIPFLLSRKQVDRQQEVSFTKVGCTEKRMQLKEDKTLLFLLIAVRNNEEVRELRYNYLHQFVYRKRFGYDTLTREDRYREEAVRRWRNEVARDPTLVNIVMLCDVEDDHAWAETLGQASQGRTSQ
jgi:hypothetical protein